MSPSDQVELAATVASANATLTAAIITAAAGAGLFLLGEALKIYRERRDRHTEAVLVLYASWEDVARISSPRIDRRFKLRRRYPERVDISVQTARLIGVLPRQDDEVVTLQVEYNQQLVRARDDDGRVEAAAKASAALTAWMASRRRGRAYARSQLKELGVDVNVNGRPVRTARPPRRVV
jgi:hypothetical protein